ARWLLPGGGGAGPAGPQARRRLGGVRLRLLGLRPNARRRPPSRRGGPPPAAGAGTCRGRGNGEGRV
ncbi:MAG: hypothetical protein AVDCRST_MAG02-2794, partial [uncultured Rubrobacteraceae bacterium]